MASTSLGPSILVSHGSSAPEFQVSGIRLTFGYKGFGRRTSRRGFRVHCESTASSLITHFEILFYGFDSFVENLIKNSSFLVCGL